MEHFCGFGRSQLYRDEGPPIGDVAGEPWGEVGFEVEDAVLQCIPAASEKPEPLTHF